MPQATLYNAEVEGLLPWLEETEKAVKALKPLSADPSDLIQQKRLLQVKRFASVFLFSVVW